MTDPQNRAVLLSVRPEWVRLILSGEKTLEIRKSFPKLELPFTVYVYQTLPKSGDWNERDGRVVASFECREIVPGCENRNVFTACRLGRLTLKQLSEYSSGKPLFGWKISNLRVFREPLPLSIFGVTKAPQNYRFVSKI